MQITSGNRLEMSTVDSVFLVNTTYIRQNYLCLLFTFNQLDLTYGKKSIAGVPFYLIK